MAEVEAGEQLKPARRVIKIEAASNQLRAAVPLP